MWKHDSLWWSQRKFENVSSYTTSTSPVWLQDAAQSLFRNVMTLHTCELLRASNGGRSFGKVVDLACGPGDWTLRYLDIAGHVVGIDINPAFIDAGKRAAAGLQNPKRAEFLHMNILDFNGYRDADLVCMGACLQHLNSAELDRLFYKVSRAVKPGTWVYVRTNVAKRSKGSYSTPAGYYRTRRAYEKVFSKSGFRVLDGFTSFSVVPSEAIRELTGVRSVKTARWLSSPIWFLQHLARKLFSKSYHYNWFLVKTDQTELSPVASLSTSHCP